MNENARNKGIVFPDHTVELKSSTKTYSELNKKYKAVLKAFKKKEINEGDLIEWKDTLKRHVEDILYQVGDLSVCVSELQEPLRMEYYSKFKPALAETLFNEEFDAAVMPYDTLKNRCFQLIGKIIGVKL